MANEAYFIRQRSLLHLPSKPVAFLILDILLLFVNHDAYAYPYPLYMVRLSKDSEICLESILIYSFLWGIYIVICAKNLHRSYYILLIMSISYNFNWYLLGYGHIYKLLCPCTHSIPKSNKRISSFYHFNV